MKTMVIKIGTCPKCKLRIIPKADGTCPNCHAVIARPLGDPRSIKSPTAPRPATKTRLRREDTAPQTGRKKSRKRISLGTTQQEALKSTWQHKVLWLPAMILFTLNLVYTDVLFNSLDMVPFLRSSSPANIAEAFSGDRLLPNLILIAFMLVNLLVYTFVLIVTYKGASHLHAGDDPLAWGSLLRQSGRYFWRLLLLYIALSFMIGLAMLPALGLVLWLFFATQGVATPTIVILFWVVMIPAFLILSVLLQYSTAALTLEDRSVNAAIRRGWEVFRRNAWLSLLLGVLLEVPLFMLSFLLSSPAVKMLSLLTSLPAVGANAGEWVLTISLAAGTVLLFIAVQAFYWVFRVTAWVFAWLRLTGIATKNPLPLRNDA